eukprot:TRINITY_DN38764_c0_g1_i1.p1 TRINITY_DN38764_c0_g1~~TRINITY_DN38764_c0_g1_i1.p1  ORF type:complete len:587 (-),score=98.21 TRINITY_DN38764_c0_g1_i1:80-1738(-)
MDAERLIEGSQPSLGELATCPVCLDLYTDPQMLPGCGHTFCRACCEPLRPSICPLCRQRFVPSKLQPNFALRAILRGRSRDHGLGGGGGAGNDDYIQSADRSSVAPIHTAFSGDFAPCRFSRELEPLGMSGLRQADMLSDLGVPPALAQVVREGNQQVGLRIFLLDNSSSTNTHDGTVYQEDHEGCFRGLPCSRWQEISSMALDQARWNLKLGTPCLFVLLNPRCQQGEPEEGVDFQFVTANAHDSATSTSSIADARGSADGVVGGSGVGVDGAKASSTAAVSRNSVGEAEELQALQRFLNIVPFGPTPLAHRLQWIRRRVTAEARELARRKQKVVLVIATDGEPTGQNSSVSGPHNAQELVRQLREMCHTLPLHIVIRLCTDEKRVVNLYNRLDEEEELDLEVIDDLQSEAKEVHKVGNSWLVYTPLIHRLREGGFFLKLFDLLDERRLTRMEVALVCQLLVGRLGERAFTLDTKAFCASLRENLVEATPVFDTRTTSMGLPLRFGEVEWIMGQRSSVLVRAAKRPFEAVTNLLGSVCCKRQRRDGDDAIG